MVTNTITLNFEIEKGEPIDRYYFSARIKLTDESKNLLREKLGSTIQFDNLDDHFNLNPENFYISYNQYGGRNQLNVRDDSSRFLTSNLPLNHNGFSMELSSNNVSSADYGFYPLHAIYNPNYYNKAKEKVFEDHGKLLPTVSNILDKLLSNANNLTTQDVFSQLQKEAAEEAEKLARERKEERQREEELNEKNEELKELIENDEIKIFKVIKGHDIGNGRSAVILQLDGEIVLDSNKYYIAKYTHHPEWEGDEYLHFVSPRDEMLVDYENLFFVLNQSSYSGFESGFYSADRTDPYNYAKYSKEPYLSGDQLSEKLSNELEEDSNQVDTEFTIDDEQVDEEVVVESEAKSGEKGTVDTIQKEEPNQMQADDGSSYVEDQPALRDDMEKTLQEKLYKDEIHKQNDEKAKQDAETKKLTTKTENQNSKVEEQAKPTENEQEAVITSVIDNMKDNKEESPHPLKIKAGESIEMGKYKVELQVTYDDIKNFYNTILGKYQASKEYNHEQASVLYNGIIMPIHGHYNETFTLPEAYVADDHLFIQGKDFGTLYDFNEMFYKSDELI
ncbi:MULTISPECIES: hypothetical protein [Wolbachia]|uniref:Uncharacterized protein n=1 Tax=Wolbachia pipientis TaxID=955 RepID=A0A7G5CCB6_WOLPI|nr:MULTISPECIES: hypothetical protein [Wolbachia]MDE5061014.1 hypothetical protein [Wolbachia endosymbiont of Drosophila nikananu]QMV46850.1 hypothetical protein HC356_01805 [Wolbachia pipientis]